MHDDINTKRTELANQMAAAGAALLDFTGTAAALAAIPDTEPQQYVAAGTPENIAAILPATICPARRQRHGERPTAPLSWEDEPQAAAVFEGYDGDTGEPIVKLLGEVQPGAKLYLGSLVPSPVPPVPAPAPQAQPLIGRLLDEFSELPVLWGLNEPGALVRHSDVFKMLVAAGKAQAAPAVPVNAAPSDDEWPTPADLLAENLENIAEQWTECFYDAPKDRIDIGAALRSEFAKLDLAHLARQAQPTDRDAVLEEAASQCEAEKVHVHKWHPSSSGDEAYNAGCDDCAAAIRAIKSGSTTEGAGS